MWPKMAIHVLPFSVGAHHQMNGSLTLLWQRDGSAVAHEEGNRRSALIEEVADGHPGIVPVRDSKTPDARPIVFSTRSWTAFVERLTD